MQLNPEKISFHIITPSYNRPTLLKRAVESVLKQSYQNWLLHIVDDGSDTETLAVLQALEMRDSRIKIYYLPKNQGVNFVRNYALNRIMAYPQEGYVTLLDDDDQLVDNALLTLCDVIDQILLYDWFIGNCISLSGKALTRIKFYGKGNYIDDYMFSAKLRGDAVHAISIKAIGEHRFTKEFRNAEEWIWLFSIAKSYNFFSFNSALKIVDYQKAGLSTLKVNDGKKLKVFQIKESLCLDLNPAYLAEQRMLLAREYFKDSQYKLGMSKLMQTYSYMYLNPKWYEIFILGLYRRVFYG